MDMLAGDVETLCSCALTCSEWHPRARYHLLTSIWFICDFRWHPTQDRLSSLRDYLDAHPTTISRVHQCFLHVKRTGLSHQEAWNFLLLRLPALRCFVITQDNKTHSCLHPTTYTRIKAHILLEELALQDVRFCTSAEFARLLVALPRLKRLECANVGLSNKEDLEIGASTARRFENKGQMLSRLEVRQCFRHRRRQCFWETHFVFVRLAAWMSALFVSSSACSSLRLRYFIFDQSIPTKQVCLPLNKCYLWTIDS